MDKILITGSSGFIGTNLVEFLLKNNLYNVLGFDINNPKIKKHTDVLRQIDIRDKNTLLKAVKEFDPTYVIHLAARTDLNGVTLEDYDSNTNGVINLVEALSSLTNVKRVIFASSMYVCISGYNPKNCDDYKPHTVYGESKVITEKIVKNSNHSYFGQL